MPRRVVGLSVLTSMAVSGFVIAYNRTQLPATFLRSLRFVDELIVIDKPSTDDTSQIARRYADRVIQLPWSPIVEETRAVALRQCQHEWVALLDDDEMPSPEAIAYLHEPHGAEAADVVALLRWHWVLGAFDPNAYYRSEHQIRYFRRGSVRFESVVHGGITVQTDGIEQVSADSPRFIEHLSHTDTEQWIERTNRYTSQEVKHWEARRGVDGDAAFLVRCGELQSPYDDLETRLGIRTGMHG